MQYMASLRHHLYSLKLALVALTSYLAVSLPMGMDRLFLGVRDGRHLIRESGSCTLANA